MRPGIQVIVTHWANFLLINELAFEIISIVCTSQVHTESIKIRRIQCGAKLLQRRAISHFSGKVISALEAATSILVPKQLWQTSRTFLNKWSNQLCRTVGSVSSPQR